MLVNKIMLHIEGFSILLLSLYMYMHFQYSWVMFVILLFAPDLSMFAYLLNYRIGAIVYNFFHTYSVAIGFILISLLLENQLLLAIGLIWMAHIGMDRMFGFGLKYPGQFKDTHLNRV